MEMCIAPNVIDSICPGMSYEDFIDYADMDVVTCLTMSIDPKNVEWVNREKKIWRDKWGALQHLTEDVISVLELPARIETDEDLDSYISPSSSVKGDNFMAMIETVKQYGKYPINIKK